MRSVARESLVSWNNCDRRLNIIKLFDRAGPKLEDKTQELPHIVARALLITQTGTTE